MNPLASLWSRYPRLSRLTTRGVRTNRSKSRRYRPLLESLEDRTVPSASISLADASMNEFGAAGAFVASGSGGLIRPHDLVIGPDGNLYVDSFGNNGVSSVIRYDGTTGQLIGSFVPSGSGGLSSSFGLAFGPDGNLYVGSGSGGTNSSVLRYNGTTGAFIDTYVPVGSGGLNRTFGVVFGADGNLYVASLVTSSILRFQGPSGPSPGSPLPATGQTGADFVPSGSGGLATPSVILFGPDGNLYVSTTDSNNIPSVLRFDGNTGAFISTFVAPFSGGLKGPRGLAFDQDGRLYVADLLSNAVHRYDNTGQYLDDPIVSTSNSLALPVGEKFDAQGRLLVASKDSNSVVRYDRGVTVTLSEATATPVSVNYATLDATALAGADYTGQTGTATFAPGQTARTILLATRDDSLSEGNETFSVQLSNPTGGATIGTGSAVVTIVDDDAKFYVINDAATDQTYEYAVNGAAGESYNLGSGNTAPRGAASDAAGTTVWIADANKNVYVYDTRGTLLGSWSAGGLNSNAQVEGIATNGTDIWLLDNYKQKVYKYTGAASLRSGSQSAASSFSLDSKNTNAKGIVTDGTYLWVVNDGSSSDKVFKYTVSGTSKGSWTIDAANSSPTGLTINPNNVSDIWIVDSGTKKVYQYTNAASKTSGSQNAAASFALSANNTNPQDIADPTPFLGQVTIAAQPASVAQPIPAQPIASSPLRSSVDWLFVNLANTEKDTERRPAERPLFPATGNQESQRLPIHTVAWQVESRSNAWESGGTTEETEAIDLAFGDGYELSVDAQR